MNIPAIAPDVADLDELERIVETNAWALYRAKLVDMIAEHVRVVENPASLAKDIRASQGALAALRRVAELPKIIEHEIRGRAVKERKDWNAAAEKY
jgi:hypothetical protein